mmetsp:Transcript_21408/g.53399  ORF Transcript_21408/g.53399 Transcript_21408/m.53399 type:complete len:261 (-) Transcript_21408:725-1507(-)
MGTSTGLARGAWPSTASRGRSALSRTRSTTAPRRACSGPSPSPTAARRLSTASAPLRTSCTSSPTCPTRRRRWTLPSTSSTSSPRACALWASSSNLSSSLPGSSRTSCTSPSAVASSCSKSSARPSRPPRSASPRTSSAASTPLPSRPPPASTLPSRRTTRAGGERGMHSRARRRGTPAGLRTSGVIGAHIPMAPSASVTHGGAARCRAGRGAPEVNRMARRPAHRRRRPAKHIRRARTASSPDASPSLPAKSLPPRRPC